jgi:hypothetical protein
VALEESVESLMARFEAAIELLVAKGLHRDDILAASLIMPACGCGALEPETARQVLRLTQSLSRALQERYA